jgi:hypothetical protein
MMATKESLNRALQKLAKWRGLFAGWQLGTRPDTDPECQAVRDHREMSLFTRVEINAMLDLLVKKGLVTDQEWIDALQAEVEQYDRDMERRFPGASTSDQGLVITKEAAPWLSQWKP